MPELRTHDYTRRCWGHNYEIVQVIDGGQQLRVAGWGPLAGPRIAEGDYLLLQGKEPGSSTRYQVAKIEPQMDPGDMWFADLDFKPRQHAVMTKENS